MGRSRRCTAIGCLVTITRLACGPLSLFALTATSLPVPTATPAPQSTLPPAPASGDAAALEAPVVSVCNRVIASVENITTTSVAYDFFFQPVPQEGIGSR